ncbi:MAG: glutamate synthase subunit alpha, partial [Deltaproteobacteria bacterium]|nr:glutamate synthase subunit alpha [Deltaproteobacteria bacterium]
MAHLQTRISTPESLHALSIARDQIVRNNAEIGLFDPNQVHDACGVAAFARKDGRPTNELIELALQGLTRMEHRGACGCDPDSSDGAGILTQIPHEFFARIVPNLPAAGQYGVATLFMPRSDYQAVKDLVRSIVTAEGLEAIHWRELGVDDSSIGFEAKRAQPVTAQLFVSRPDNIRAAEYEKLLYFLQKRIRKECVSEQAPLSAGNLYCCSFSSKSIVYKGLCLPSRLGQYFDDLKQPDFASSLAIVHSRFATNALPQWPLAHPYRVLAHNGEINTVQGNRNVMGSLDRLFASTLFGERAEDVGQMVSQVGSDTRSLDGALQLLIHGGLSLEHGLRVLIPEAFEGRKDLSPEARAFYRYHSGLMSPWDGPASVVASDGERLAAVSDRNGLRPQRLVETNSGLLVIASEDGIIDIEPGDIKRRAAGTAGGMFAFSPDTGLRTSDEVIEELFRKDPELYREAETRRVMLAPSFKSSPDPDNELSSERRRFLQRAFGYTEEDLRILIAPLVIDGEQPLGSMGDDTPLAVLSTQARPLFDYFKQLFAQVTNPPIDPIREEHVTSLTTHLGPKGNILLPDAKNGELIELASPLLSHADISAVREIAEQRERFRIETLDLTFDVGKPGALKAALNNLCRQAEEAVRNGTGILTLSDKAVDENRAAIPSLLATSALHQHLSRKGIRHSTSIVVESGEPREVHHFACLLGFGADAVHPYLLLDQLKEYADFAGNDPEKAQYNGIKA